MKRAAVIYHFFPHYRDGVIKALNLSEDWEYVWIGADIEAFDGIKASAEWKCGESVDAPFRSLGNVIWQPRVVSLALTSRWDAAIFLANPYYLTTWIAALICRIRGIRVLFWTHGWVGEDKWLKRFVRIAFLRLADALLLYGERAKQIALEHGFNEGIVHVIYNSLDYERQLPARDAVCKLAVQDVRLEALANWKLDTKCLLLVCVARLTKACRFDLLIEAMEKLRNEHGIATAAVLVGHGPERESLGRMADAKGVSVCFYGPCYDELALAKIFYGSDVTVSPGKIGLTAIHSLMYGTPVITHDRMDRQFPEVEAIRDGVTGAFFRYDDSSALAKVLKGWLEVYPVKAPEVVQACFRVVDEIFNPNSQRTAIERALDGETSRDLRIS